MYISEIIAAISGALIAGLVLWARQSRIVAVAMEKANQFQLEVDRLKNELTSSEIQCNELRDQITNHTAAIAQKDQRIIDLQENDVRLVSEFERLSKTILAESSEQLTKSAESSFKLARQETKGELDQHRLRIEHLVNPVNEHLAKLEKHIAESENARKEEFGSMFTQLKSVAETNLKVENEAKQLKNVLRTSSTTRGRWGEVQLRRVVELAGMIEHCDFSEQTTVSSEGESGREISRADLIIRLPGNILIPVDAKVPYDSYEQAQTLSDDPIVSSQKLNDHAIAFKKHVDALAAKKYWEKYTPTCGFTVLFVPGDALLDAALSKDIGLWEKAAENKILLATPSTLIALLRMAHLGWRQQAQAENAEDIAKVGRELYSRLGTMSQHLRSMGQSLQSTVNRFNDFVGSVEGRVIPSARKLSKLGNAMDADEITAPEEITRTTRVPREDLYELPEST